MPSTILTGDFTIYFNADNNQRRIEWTGSATGTRTVNALYSALQDLFDDPAQMDDLVPIRADTPDIYRLINAWFIDDTTMEHLTGGSIYTSGWKVGTTENVLIIGYNPSTAEFNTADIGRTIVGATTTDTGTILDFNTGRDLVWIRPDDPAAAGDEFDNGTEAYSIKNNPFNQVWNNNGGATWGDETVDANDVDNADWNIFNTGAATDIGYFGFAQKFSKLIFDNLNGTAGTVGTVTWQYWNGAWTNLAGVTDGTSQFKAAVSDGQVLTYTVPTDWVTTSVNGSAQLYFIRADVGTAYTIAPIYDQGFVGGVGAGAFASHTRHGAASAEGESAWAGISSEFIGSDTTTGSHVYIYQEGPNVAAGGFSEARVVATKGTSDWWSNGPINVLLKVKEADSYFGQSPGSTPATTVAVIPARQYSRQYGVRKAVNLPTAGGNVSAPIGAGDDMDNATGYRRLVMSGDSGNFAVDDRISNDASTPRAVILAITGTTPTRTLDYYLINEPQVDFVDTNTVTNLDGTGTGTVNGAPTNIGPASDTTITVTSGTTTENINNGNGARPYSVRINPASLSIEEVYERTKYLTRFGETSDIDSSANHVAVGESYVGNELQIEYQSQTGNFGLGLRLTGGTSTATGIIVGDHDDGTTGDLILRDVRGTFSDGETITDTATGSAAISTGGRRAITPISAAPFGTFAGGTFYGAPGVCLTTANLATGDEQAYQLIDDDGTIQTPPNTRSVEITNLTSGDTVAMLRLNAATAGDVDKDELSLAASNNLGNTTVVVSATINNTHPTVAHSKVRVVSPSGQEHRYRYASFTSATFTLSTASTGTDGGTGTNTTIVNAGATFVTNGVEVGDLVRNTTDAVSYSVVTAVAQTTLTVTNNGVTWQSKGYSVNTLVENYPAGQNVYVPFIERIADTATESNTIVAPTGAGTIDVWCVVRNAGTILPFDVVTTITNTGRSQAAIRTSDDIYS